MMDVSIGLATNAVAVTLDPRPSSAEASKTALKAKVAPKAKAPKSKSPKSPGKAKAPEAIGISGLKESEVKAVRASALYLILVCAVPFLPIILTTAEICLCHLLFPDSIVDLMILIRLRFQLG